MVIQEKGHLGTMLVLALKVIINISINDGLSPSPSYVRHFETLTCFKKSAPSSFAYIIFTVDSAKEAKYSPFSRHKANE